MERTYHSKRRGGARGETSRWVRLVGAATFSLTLSAAVVASGTETRVGASTSWPWVLMGLQVLALWSAGSGRWWGWLVGAAVQPSWIAYAVVTSQLGFIPGCVVSAAVQTHSFMTRSSRRHVTEAQSLGAVNRYA